MFAALPDPGRARTLDELIEQLRALRAWAGDPSYAVLTDRINTIWSAAARPAGELTRKSTVADCFRIGRRRLNTDLVIAVVQALHPDVGYVAQWRQALRVIGAESQAASQVRVQDCLPQDLAEFTGRIIELDQLHLTLRHTRQDGAAVVISAIAGMAGVGKTQLAVHAGHQLLREKAFDRVLFVNLRGFHPDPAQPPADPAAVLDGFLRLLGVSGQHIPHDLSARAAAYHDRLVGTRTLVVLDNAADTEQVRPLLAATPGCLTLVTSRRILADLNPATHLTVDVFTPAEAVDFLTSSMPDVPVGSDPNAAARVAGRCGHLPLALGLVAGHIRGTPGWTLTDHADRLDERHDHQQLDSGVQLALHLSYQHLPTDRQRLLRLASLHPGQDFDAYAAAALTGVDLPTAHDHLHQLCRDHLLQQPSPGRYGLHDLVRTFAAGRASDEDSPPQRRAALTRLLNYYAATAAIATDLAYPYEAQRRPVVLSASSPVPELADQNRAVRWLDAELDNLLAAAQHAPQHGRPEHAWQLSAVLDRHLRTRGRYREAETLHQHARRLALQLGNHQAEIAAVNCLGYIHRLRGRYQQADDHYRRALQAARDIGHRGSEVDALCGLGDIDWRLGREREAGDHFALALQIARDIGHRSGEVNALYGLGFLHWLQGRYELAGDHYGQALDIAQSIGHPGCEVNALFGLGHFHGIQGRYDQAHGCFRRALQTVRDIGDRGGEVDVLGGLGYLHRMQGRYDRAGDCYGLALQIAQKIGFRKGELQALSSLGHLHLLQDRHEKAADCYQQVLGLSRELGGIWQFEALQALGRLYHATGRRGLALSHHERALQHATDLAHPIDQARAHDGLAHAHLAVNEHEHARRHWQYALEILTNLDIDHTQEVETSVPIIRAHLTNLNQRSPIASD